MVEETLSIDPSLCVLSASKCFTGSLVKAKELVDSLGSFSNSKPSQINLPEVKQLSKDVATLFLDASAVVADIFVDLNALNEVGDAMPPVARH